MIELRPNKDLDHETVDLAFVRERSRFSFTIRDQIRTDSHIAEWRKTSSEDEIAQVMTAATEFGLRGRYDVGVRRRTRITPRAGWMELDLELESTFFLIARCDVRYIMSLKTASEVMET